MRLLSLDIDYDILDFLEDGNYYICDEASDIDDAIYHSEVRYYNIILIKHKGIKKIKELLSKINPKFTAVVCLIDNLTVKNEVSLLKSGAIYVNSSDIDFELLIERIKSIHKENFLETYTFNNKYLINKEEESISDENNKLVLKGKPFSVLEYLVKNRHRTVVSKDELLSVLWDDPEWVAKNVIEVNINVIRKGLNKEFQDDLIDTIRNRGYKIA